MISLAQDTVNYLYRLESLLTVDEMYCEMLKYVENHCVYPVVQEAAANLYSVINDGVAGIIADIALKAANLAGEKTIDFALKTACDSCLPFAIIKAGFDWGVTLSNVLFKTGKTQELKDSLRSQAFLANCLALWTLDNGVEYLRSIDTDKETENGRKFYYSLYMVWKARINAEETLQNLLKTEKVEWCKNYSISVNVKNLLKSYQDQLFSEERMQKMLGVAISCPVNVEIYDASGTKILTLMDGKECQGYENGIYYYCSYNLLSEDYEKYIYYNAKDNYHINLVGADLGLVDCSVSSIDDNGNIVEYYFYNKEIDSDTVIMLDNISKDGIDYHIKKNDGEKIDLSMERKSPNVILATSLSLNKTSFEMKKNDKCLLTVSFVPINATNQNVTWSSSDETVALVNSDGVITAVASGTATISASLGDLKQNCEITVKESNSENLHCKHQYIWVTDKFPTRTEEGSKHLECLLCGSKIVFVSIPKIAVSNNDDKNVSDLGTVYLDAESEAIYKITKDDANARTASYLKTKATSGTLTVPDAIRFKGKTYNVTEIGNEAGSNNAKITKVIIGKNVTSVGQGAFSRCSKLKTVTIGKGVTSIGKNAFFGCSQLKTVAIGKNVTSIKSKAFSRCVSLKQVVIPSKVKNIGSKAFYGCRGLKKLTMKTTKLTGKSIGSKAFSGVSKKVTVKVPKGKLKSYKKLLRKKGIGKKAKVK